MLSALFLILPSTVEGLEEPYTVFTSATTPATWGVDIEVPLMDLYFVSPLPSTERMLEPGAATSTCGPSLENEQNPSEEVEQLTTMTPA